MSLMHSAVWVSLGLYARIFHRKVQLQFLCWVAKRRFQEIEDLMYFVGFVFKEITPRFSAIRLYLLNDMGYGTDSHGQRVSSICWNAPIALTVYMDECPYLGLGIELRGKTLCIRQMQGVKGVKQLPELHGWPELLVRTCMNYAETHGLREVRVYKADQEIGFAFPQIEASEGQTKKEAIEAHQNRMRCRYDRTAQKLKFKKNKRYYVWKVPPQALAA